MFNRSLHKAPEAVSFQNQNKLLVEWNRKKWKKMDDFEKQDGKLWGNNRNLLIIRMLLHKLFHPIVSVGGGKLIKNSKWTTLEGIWIMYYFSHGKKEKSWGRKAKKKISKGFELSERNSSWVALLHGNWTCSSITPHLSPSIILRKKNTWNFNLVIGGIFLRQFRSTLWSMSCNQTWIVT